MPRPSYKLPIGGRQYVFQLLDKGEKNSDIIEKIKAKYGVEVSGAYISQLKSKKSISDLNVYSTDVEKKIKEKQKIDVNILEMAREMTDIFKNWLMKNKEYLENKASPKEASMVASSFHKFFNSYKEMAGGTETRETVHTAIIQMAKKAEMNKEEE